MRFFYFAALLGVISSFAAPTPPIVAKVNGEVITESDLKSLQRPGEKETETLERMILFRLAVQQARKQELAESPAVKQEIDRALYRAYLEKSLGRLDSPLSVSDDELRTRYAANPRVRLRHLGLTFRNPVEKTQAESTLEKIDKELKANAPFKKLVLKYSRDESKLRGGDLDFRELATLPEVLRDDLKDLKIGRVTKPILLESGYHLFEIMELQPFDKVPAMIQEKYRSELLHEKEALFLKSQLMDLRKSARVEILKP